MRFITDSPMYVMICGPMKALEKIKGLLLQHKIMLIILGVAVCSMGLNMSKFPYFEGDEGIYVSRAVALVQDGKFSTGTYWYDHPPFGWLLIGIWLTITKSNILFESLLTSGRVFILIMNLVNVGFIYYIANKMTNNKYLSVLAALTYALSPLQIYFGRRILLDNIMSFLVISSIFAYLYTKKWWVGSSVSAILFALAVLTKENAILFSVPLLLLQLWFPNETTLQNKRKSIAVWISIATLIISIYPAYALSRGELFPTGYFDSGGKPSLISTLIYQSKRDSSEVFDFVKNPFWKHLKYWTEEDPVIVGLGSVAITLNLIIGAYKKNRNALLLAAFALVQVLFFMRGGVVMEFYILPLIPIIALNIALAFSFFCANDKTDLKFVIPVCILLVTTGLLIKNRNPFLNNQTSAQMMAVNWIKENKKEYTTIVSDSYAKADLYGQEGIEIKSHFDAEYDDGFEKKILSKKQKVDYIIYTKQVEWDLDNLDFVRNLLKNTKLSQEFKSDGWDIKIYEPISTP